jgi:SAM-dependent methyltransferase
MDDSTLSVYSDPHFWIKRSTATMASDKPDLSEESVWSQRLDGSDHFSCSTEWGPGEVIKYFWQDIFGSAKHGSRVLEIGCGSGQVSFWGAEAGRGLKFVASDRIVAPGGSRFQHPDISYMGEVAAEQLPFAQDSFDLVVSNFAIEYAGFDMALSEAARVLAPGGTLILVLHSSDSGITQSSRQANSIYEALVRARVPAQVREAAMLPQEDPSRHSLLQSVCARRQEFSQAAEIFLGVEYFDFAKSLLGDEPPVLKDLDALDQSVALRRDISREQSRVALDVDALRHLEQQLQQLGLSGFTSEMTCTYDEKHTEKVAWICIFTRIKAVSAF